MTLSSPEVRFHMDSETHDPIDLQTKELRYAVFFMVDKNLILMQYLVYLLIKKTFIPKIVLFLVGL